MAAKKPEPEAEVPKKKGKLLIIVSALVLVLGAGGGGAWFFLKPGDPNAAKAEAPAKPAVFMPLEMFTVNLAPQDGGQTQYLQAGLTLKLGEQVKEATIKDKMPEIRDRILMVLSSKKASDVLPAEGKRKLAQEIVAAVIAVVGVPPAKAPAALVQAEPAPGEAAAAEPPAKKKAAAKAEGEAEEAEAAPPPKPVRKVAAAPQIEVLFTSFIVQ